MEIIGIVGRKRHGKSLIGEILESNGYTAFSFAGALKCVCEILFDFTHEQLEGDEKEVVDPRYGLIPRDLFRIVGNNLPGMLPRVFENLWIDILFRDIAKTPGLKQVVITDVRFTREVEAIKSRGGKLLRVYRPGMDDSDKHTSETELDSLPTDYTIINDGSIDDLRRKVVTTLSLDS